MTITEMHNKLSVHDITVLMHDNMPCWPGEHHTYKHQYVKSFDKGDKVNISRISCSMHLGTHIDAPYHKTDNGKKLSELPLDRFMGDAYVFDLTGVVNCITFKDVEDLNLRGCTICLFKTKNSDLWKASKFYRDYIFIDKEAARLLAAKGVKAVGIDYLSVDKFEAEAPYTHNIFFEENILVYEGLDLSGVNEGQYYFIGLPLRVQNAEGSPVRAILLDKK